MTIYALTGVTILAGVVTAITGMGAGMITTSTLILFGGDPTLAAGAGVTTSWIIRLTDTALIAHTHSINQTLSGREKLVRPLLFGSLCGALSGITVGTIIDASQLRIIIGATMLVTAGIETLRQLRGINQNTNTASLPAMPATWVLVTLGAIGTAAAAITSTGVGAIIGTGLMATCRKLSAATIVQITIVVTASSLTIVVVLRALTGDIPFAILLLLAPAGCLGALLGGLISHTAPERTIRLGLIALTGLLGLGMVIL